jgi:hypothetical protein
MDQIGSTSTIKVSKYWNLSACFSVSLYVSFIPFVESDKETKRQRYKETKRQRDKKTKRQRDKETKRQRDNETKRH